MQKHEIKRKYITRYIMQSIIALLLMLTVLGTVRNVYARDVLYVAGIPDEYPLEYYDKTSGSYQGVLSGILQTAAKNAGLSVSYIDASNKDNRLSLAKNVQIDVVCTMNLSDKELKEVGLTKGMDIFSYQQENQTIHISFAYSQSIAPENRERLEQELQKVDKNELMKLLVQSTQVGYEGNTDFIAFHRIIPIVSCILCIVLFFMPFLFIRKRKQIEKITFMDDGTKHYNYAMWKLKYKQYIKKENSRHYAVLYLDLGLENISHIYGYREVTDAVHRISDVCVMQIDDKYEGVSRFNELYFVFFVRFSSDEKLKERILNIQQAIQKAFEEQNKRYFLELHTGVYKLTHMESDIGMIIQYSEVATEYAKAHYLDTAIYNDAVERETLSSYIMEHEAIHGLMQDEFIMYLQPMQDTKSGEICGAETLVRWNNPSRGLLKPGEFLDIMRRKNLIGKMDMEIYRQGCRLLCREAKKGNYPSLLFNFSSEIFEDDGFADELFAIAQHYEIHSKQMIIQLNQLTDGTTTNIFIENVCKLRKFQFNVSLSGLELDKSFFEYLKYDVNYIKLRRELLQNADTTKGKKVLRSVVQLCHDLKLNIICIGVEKEEQAKLLQELSCDIATGYYYHFPVNQEVFSNLLEDEKENQEDAN